MEESCNGLTLSTLLVGDQIAERVFHGRFVLWRVCVCRFPRMQFHCSYWDSYSMLFTSVATPAVFAGILETRTRGINRQRNLSVLPPPMPLGFPFKATFFFPASFIPSSLPFCLSFFLCLSLPSSLILCMPHMPHMPHILHIRLHLMR